MRYADTPDTSDEKPNNPTASDETIMDKGNIKNLYLLRYKITTGDDNIKIANTGNTI